jgi:hypothetical protein
MSNEHVSLLVQLVYKEVFYALPLRAVVELLVMHPDLLLTRMYTVESDVAVETFNGFYCWLFAGMERPVPEAQKDEWEQRAAEFGIATPIEPRIGGCLHRCLDACVREEMFRRFERFRAHLNSLLDDAQATAPQSSPSG